MKRARVRALALSLLAIVSTRVALAQCSKDLECKGDRVCNAGVCEAPSGAAPAPVAASPVVAPPVRAQTVRPFNQPPAEPAQYRRNSSAMMVSGIVATSLGVASLATALGLGIVSVDCNSRLDDEGSSLPASPRSDGDTCRGYSTAADVTVISGLVLTGAGIPLLLIGARKVPVSSEALVAPWLSPRGAGLSFRLAL
jgi:hypothetical protein